MLLDRTYSFLGMPLSTLITYSILLPTTYYRDSRISSFND